MKRNLVMEKSFKFSVQAIKLYTKAKKRREFVLADQFMRSATSIGANVHEATGAESRKDFIHKMSIASKEARETLYWIDLFKASNILGEEPEKLNELRLQCDELVRLLTSIVRTSTNSKQAN